METSRDQIPEYLYYYTDIDTLALILKNHTIRLNSLDKMDDKQEQMSKDKQNFGKFVFISSWTEDEVEQIPMWRMYTPKGRGVRIKLKSNPFRSFESKDENVRKYYFVPEEQNSFDLIMPDTHLWRNNFYCSTPFTDKILHRITYLEPDDTMLNPEIVKYSEDSFDINISPLGKYKNRYWDFQKEWRYLLVFIPISLYRLLSLNGTLMLNDTYGIIDSIKKGSWTLPFDYYDLIITDECFEDMSIRLSPDIAESSRIIAKLLVEKYNPSCKIIESDLKDLIQ